MCETCTWQPYQPHRNQKSGGLVYWAAATKKLRCRHVYKLLPEILVSQNQLQLEEKGSVCRLPWFSVMTTASPQMCAKLQPDLQAASRVCRWVPFRESLGDEWFSALLCWQRYSYCVEGYGHVNSCSFVCYIPVGLLMKASLTFRARFGNPPLRMERNSWDHCRGVQTLRSSEKLAVGSLLLTVWQCVGLYDKSLRLSISLQVFFSFI